MFLTINLFELLFELIKTGLFWNGNGNFILLIYRRVFAHSYFWLLFTFILSTSPIWITIAFFMTNIFKFKMIDKNVVSVTPRNPRSRKLISALCWQSFFFFNVKMNLNLNFRMAWWHVKLILWRVNCEELIYRILWLFGDLLRELVDQ